MLELPLPPLNLRKSVGPIEDHYYSNPNGGLVFVDEVPADKYDSVFDFGCGCGRNARQMMQQTRGRPRRYVGVDLYRESIDWCVGNLQAADPNFSFYHLNVHNAQFNPQPEGSRTHTARFPVEETFKLVNAHSVFTHIVEPYLDHYLAECARILHKDGMFRATWLLFDKRGFPVMQEFQNCLYVNLDDPTQATVYDHQFVARKYAEFGMTIVKILPPAIRGYQWTLLACRKSAGAVEAPFPEDVAPIGIARAPVRLA
jgi:SAM-dependent methyltransferase